VTTVHVDDEHLAEAMGELLERLQAGEAVALQKEGALIARVAPESTGDEVDEIPPMPANEADDTYEDAMARLDAVLATLSARERAGLPAGPLRTDKTLWEALAELPPLDKDFERDIASGLEMLVHKPYPWE
jgi:antitoxin (DNA-binding transcriptional repressor) of toxin-antitoxin stability system